MAGRHLLSLVVATLAVLSGVACGQPRDPGGSRATATETEPVQFRLGQSSAVGSLLNVSGNELVEEVDRATRGALKGTVFPAGQLASQQELVERLQLGDLEIAVTSSTFVGVMPEFGIFELPYAFQNRDEAKRAVDGPLGKELAAQADTHNLVLLGYWENGIRHITNNVRPIRTPVDLRGLRIRTPADPERVELFQAWGARPSPLDLSLLFGALKAGTFDGQENPASQIVTEHLNEVQHYVSMTGHIYSPGYVIASKQWWESLEPRLQAVVLDAVHTTADNSRRRGENADRDAAARFAELGMQVNDDVDKAAFQRASAPIYAEYEKRFGSHLLQLLAEATGRMAPTATRVRSRSQ
jgi:TRAP-type transport system periplasmic protein